MKRKIEEKRLVLPCAATKTRMEGSKGELSHFGTGHVSAWRQCSALNVPYSPMTRSRYGFPRAMRVVDIMVVV